MTSLIAEILLLSSFAAFIIGIFSLMIPEIRIKERSRYYFLFTLLLFAVSLLFGWSDFVCGFESARNDF